MEITVMIVVKVVVMIEVGGDDGFPSSSFLERIENL